MMSFCGYALSILLIPIYVGMIGSNGPAADQYQSPFGIAVDRLGRIYVADGSGKVQLYSNDGSWITSIGAAGNADGRLSYPMDVAVRGDGVVYVADGDSIK